MKAHLFPYAGHSAVTLAMGSTAWRGKDSRLAAWTEIESSWGITSFGQSDSATGNQRNPFQEQKRTDIIDSFFELG